MECTIQWAGEGMAFSGKTGSGHTVMMDNSLEGGGQNLGPRPMELLLLGAGGCTAFDVVLILKRGRHEVSGCEVRLVAERATSDPKVFTQAHFHYRVKGTGLKTEVVARAIELSQEKYCSASIMLGKTAKLTHDFEIVEA